MKLEKLVDLVLHLHEERLSPVKRDIRIPYQLNFPQLPTTSKNKVLMGRYYEFVTQAFYGGKLSDLRYFDNKNNEQEELFLIKPDIVDNKRKKIAESKACVSGHKLNLMDEQIERYKSLQYDNPNSIVYFAVYRHILTGIKSKYKGSEDELFKELSKKTKNSITSRHFKALNTDFKVLNVMINRLLIIIRLPHTKRCGFKWIKIISFINYFSLIYL